MSNDLTKSESDKLRECETIIEHGLETFVEVGTALLEIRDLRLYRATHRTFELYCRDRWEMSRSRAYQLIEASKIVENLSTTVDIPANERQVRTLAVLTPEEQREVWTRVVETAPDGRVTSEYLQVAVNEAIHQRKPLKPPKWTKSERDRRKLVESGQTVVANKRTDLQLVEWAKSQRLFVEIDRPTVWWNPFVLDEDGDRRQICEAYRIYLYYKLSLQKRFDELRGKVLGCWCYPERCHGDTLIQMLKGDREECPIATAL